MNFVKISFQFLRSNRNTAEPYMRRNLRSIVLLFLFLTCITENCFAGGMYFIENRGQWESDILFRTEIPGGFLFSEKTITRLRFI